MEAERDLTVRVVSDDRSFLTTSHSLFPVYFWSPMPVVVLHVVASFGTGVGYYVRDRRSEEEESCNAD